MIIDDLIDFTDSANSLAESLRNQESESDRIARETDYIARFSKYINNLDVMDSMNSIMPLSLKTNDFNTIEHALRSGERVYKNLKISNNVPITTVQEAVDLQEKLKLKWKKQYLSSDQVTETLSMLELLMPIYKGTPKPKDLIDSIEALENDSISADTVNGAKQSIDDAKKMLDTLEIDEDVKSFLKKVSTHNASLLDVNENILNWLKTNNLLKRMKITNV